MEESLKKIVVFISMIILALTLSTLKVNSVNASGEKYLPFNTIVSGEITDSNTVNTYKIVLPKDGRLTANVDSSIYTSKIDLLDSNWNKVWNGKYIEYGEPNDPVKWSNWEDLEAGTYYIKIYKYSSYTGKYSLSVNFDQANNNDIDNNNGTSTAQIITSGQKINGFISWNDDVDYYKIILPKAGRLTVNIDSSIYSSLVDLYDNEGNKVWSREYVEYGKATDPKKWNGWEDLEPGTYYIKIYKYSSYTGKYTLSVKYEQANNTEKEPNNGTTKAQSISLNSQKVTGFISWNDDTDYYKFTLPRAGNVSFNVDSNIYSTLFTVYDSKGNTVVGKDYIEYGSPTSPKKWSISKTLATGTYYIKINKYSNYTGKYNLLIKAPFLLPTTPTVNVVSTNSTYVSGKTSPNTTVSLKIGTKVYSKNSNSKGEYKISIPKQKASTKIYVSAKNSYGTSSVKTVTVGAVATTPSIGKITTKSTYVTGKTSKSATVYVKIGKKTYTGASNSKGDYKIKIAKQKAGTKIYVSAKNSYGTSGKRTIVVKKA